MARRFTRRKPRVVWLPVFGDAGYGEGGGAEQSIGIMYANLLGTGQSNISVDSSPLTFDQGDSAAFAQDTDPTAHSLSDFVQGQSYRLRRIVGKVWVQANNQNLATNIVTIKCGFGFIVGRSDSAGNIQTQVEQVNPLSSDSAARDPWIWRRTWLIGIPGMAANIRMGQGVPQSNMQYGSVADGPHIDQKTARIVSGDERLIAVFASQVMATANDLAPTGTVVATAYLDYRLLASMRSNMGNRKNTTR